MVERFFPTEVHPEDVRLPIRRADAHKGDFGRVLICAGSVGFTGAPAFAARAAVRSGAGLVFLMVPEDIYAIEAVKNDEAMVFPLPEDAAAAAEAAIRRLDGCDALLLGPGLGLSDFAEHLTTELLRNAKVPVILDADGITLISRHIDILDKLSCPVIMTPHEGEFARLSPLLETKSRVEAAALFAVEHHVTLVLKGSGTVTALPDGRVFVNTTGNAGMATGGSGDVLAGMILSLIGQGIPPDKAVPWAVCLHGRAGDIAAERFGQYAMTPSDMIDILKSVMR